jgi:hypothetical protein
MRAAASAHSEPPPFFAISTSTRALQRTDLSFQVARHAIGRPTVDALCAGLIACGGGPDPKIGERLLTKVRHSLGREDPDLEHADPTTLHRDKAGRELAGGR